MSLKTQDTRVYRGMVWVGRLYRFAGWTGLIATFFFTIWSFFYQWDIVSRYWRGATFGEILLQSLALAAFCLIMGLFLSAVAFGISLGIQVGLTLMKNSQTQVDLLRRMTQHQSEADSVLRLTESHELTDDELRAKENSAARQRV